MPSEIEALTDYVVDILQAALTAGGVGTTVTREYDVEWDLGTYTGLQVNVFPVSYHIDSPATRREDYLDSMVVAVVSERYTEPGKPPKAWMDQRIQWVEELIFSPLAVIQQPLILNKYWSMSPEVTTIYDIKFLRQHKVFWSEVECIFRKLRNRV